MRQKQFNIKATKGKDTSRTEIWSNGKRVGF